MRMIPEDRRGRLGVFWALVFLAAAVVVLAGCADSTGPRLGYCHLEDTTEPLRTTPAECEAFCYRDEYCEWKPDRRVP